MTEPQRKQRNADRPLELLPIFRNRHAKVVEELEGIGIRPRIQDAYRNLVDQLTAFNTGPVDLLNDDSPLQLSKTYLLKGALVSRKNRLITGIRWGVPKKLRGAIDIAVDSQDWNAQIKIGWHPSYVEPIGISASEARSGKRPA